MAGAWRGARNSGAHGFLGMSSSGEAVTAGGVVRILEARRGEEVEEEEEAPPSPLARARRCDVYVSAAAERGAVEWLRAELEMLGVRCVVADRRRCRDAAAHAAARAAMDVAAAGVVVVTPASLGNAYCVEEIRVFVERGNLVPLFVGLGRADLDADDVVDKAGDLWERFGGHLWKLYGGEEGDWRGAVDALARAEPAVEVGAGNLRYCLLDLIEIVGARLGRRAVTEAVRTWRAAADLELPFFRNAGFVGREKELHDLEALLVGDVRARDKAAAAGMKRPLHLVEVEAALGGEGAFVAGAICISGEAGTGKTELVLEFAHRHAHEYKKVLWVRGEARHLRLSYLKLADQLGVAVGDDISLPAATDRSGDGWCFHGMEGDAIAKVRKELTREIPYLLVIDNLESERDWWDGRFVDELLPGAAGERTHVIVTTRLRSLRRVRTFTLPSLAPPETMLLMKGACTFAPEDTMVLRAIEQKLRGVPLGLALVGAILSELAVDPAELRHAMNNAPYRAPTWEEKDEPALRDNPGLVQLLDVCFALLDGEKAGLAAAAARIVEASAFFAPAPIPVPVLAVAVCADHGKPLWKRMLRALHISCTTPSDATERGAESAALATLLQLGIARRCTAAGYVAVHAVFRRFSRKVGSGHAARAAVRAIAAEGKVEEHADHMWAACLSLFKFEAPAPAVELPTLELAHFVTRVVLPLAAHAVAAYSSYSAALELLREATDAVHAVEDLFLAPPPRHHHGSSGTGAGVELDPAVYQELARARAQLLLMRAKIMMRGGEYSIAENHCLMAIGILEVVSGDDHRETQAARAVLDKVLEVQLRIDPFSSRV